MSGFEYWLYFAESCWCSEKKKKKKKKKKETLLKKDYIASIFIYSKEHFWLEIFVFLKACLQRSPNIRKVTYRYTAILVSLIILTDFSTLTSLHSLPSQDYSNIL